MDLKRERIDNESVSDNSQHSRSKRIRKQSQEYAGQLKGEFMEQAVEKALNQLDRQSVKMYGYKGNPIDTYSANENLQLKGISYSVNRPIVSNDFQQIMDGQENCKKEYQDPSWSPQPADDQEYTSEYLPPVYKANGLSDNLNDKVDMPKSLSSSSFTSGRNDNLPVLKIANGGGVCGVCGKQFSRMDNCTNHFLQLHGESYREKDIICLVCKEAFAFERNLSNHMKKIHKISDRIEIVQGSDGLLAKSASGKGVCLVCCKVFTRMDNCKNHFKLHQNQSANISGIVKQVSNTYSHENTMHQNSDHGSLLGNIYEESASVVKYEGNYNNNDMCSNAEEFAGNPNHFEDETFPLINPSDKRLSSDTNVEKQVDREVDPSTMLEVKSEWIDPENRKTITAVGIVKAEINEKCPPVKRSNMKKDKLPKTTSSKKLQRKTEKADGAYEQSKALNALMKVTKMESGQALCEVCGNIFSRIDKARDHFLKFHGEDDDMKNCFCQICNEGYVFEQNLKAHMKSAHGISTKLIPYEGCGGNLAKTEDGAAFCLICKKKYSRIDKAKDHYNKTHQSKQSSLHDVVQELRNLKEYQE